MSQGRPSVSHARLAGVADQLRQPEMLALLPALTLAAFWMAGETALILTALGLPALMVLAGRAASPVAALRAGEGTRGTVAAATRAGIIAALEQARTQAVEGGKSTACLVLQLDDSTSLADRIGRDALADIIARISDRLAGALRGGDTIAQLDELTFAVALAPLRRFDLETGLQIAARLQSVAEAPFSIDASTVHATLSVGLCLAARAPGESGQDLLTGALAALDEARRNGPGAMRAYSPEMKGAVQTRHALSDAIADALETGQIIAYFQPQVSTDTGRITGFEALARWQHPERGILSPGEFLPAVHAAGLSERLSEVMVGHALAALRTWDRAAMNVPTVAVNFSHDELCNPRLAERLKWDCDRFGLTPNRLTVEILETVVADTRHDVIVRNIAALAALGCGIDLDDFGTGHASIGSIRRFSVARIKIDRSFVTRLVQDQDQQKMVAAILSMAERLGVDTLAEGVETGAEHALLAQLGCRHVQGFALARPMSLAESLIWIPDYAARQVETPRLGRSTA